MGFYMLCEKYEFSCIVNTTWEMSSKFTDMIIFSDEMFTG